MNKLVANAERGGGRTFIEGLYAHCSDYFDCVEAYLPHRVLALGALALSKCISPDHDLSLLQRAVKGRGLFRCISPYN